MLENYQLRILSVFLCLFLLGFTVPVMSQDAVTSASDTIYVSDGTLRRIYVPILMYHYVSPLPSNADSIRIDLTVSPDTFREHIQYLRNAGYETISLYQLYNALVAGLPLPPKPVILTFDDGYVDHYEYVFPVLQEFGFTGTFFIITDIADANTPGYLTWAQIREMAGVGMSLESHAKNHVDLAGRDRDFLVYQIIGSLESLEANIGQSAAMFCYPSGRYDETTLTAIEQFPVLLAVTTRYGAYHTTSSRFELPRLRVSNDTDVTALERLLAGSR